MELFIQRKDLVIKSNETGVLFIDDLNMFQSKDPSADLVLVTNFDFNMIKDLEKKQLGVYRIGGNYKKALEDSGLSFRLIARGKKSEFNGDILALSISCEYKVISGNY